VPKHKLKTQQLTERDAQIAGRLREAREFLRFKQKEFAQQIGIGRERLASYEDGRVSLRWEIALRLCRQFFISELWLARGITAPDGPVTKFGEGESRMMVGLLLDSVVQRLRPGQRFDDAFDQVLYAEYVKLRLRNQLSPAPLVIASDNAEYIQNAFNCKTANWKYSLPWQVRDRFIIDLLKAGAVLFRELNRKARPGQIYHPESATPLETVIEKKLSFWNKQK
jgi:DNA-binding XRE family transcriptional regulator